MSEHRGPVVTAALGLVSAIVGFFATGREAPKWAAVGLMVVLAVALALVIHYYIAGGLPL